VAVCARCAAWQTAPFVALTATALLLFDVMSV